jgi:WD40 repeat protein
MSNLIFYHRVSYPFQGHQEEVNSVSFSPDGKIIASASKDKTIRLWNIESGESKTLKDHQERVWRVRYSPMSGNMIASSDIDKTAILYAADTGKFLRSLKGHTSIIYDLSFSPDSKKIATASWDGTIKIWDTSTGNEQETLENLGDQDKVYSLDFNVDGTKLASGGYKDGSVKLWDLNSRTSKVIGRHQKPVTFVRFSHDDQILASSSDDGIIQLWKDGQLLTSIKAHEKYISGLDFSPNSKILASASEDSTIKLWQIDGTRIKTLVGHRGAVNEISFSPNHQEDMLIASASQDTTVRRWKIISGENNINNSHLYDRLYINLIEKISIASRIGTNFLDFVTNTVSMNVNCPKCHCNPQDCRNHINGCCSKN